MKRSNQYTDGHNPLYNMIPELPSSILEFRGVHSYEFLRSTITLEADKKKEVQPNGLEG